MLIFTMTFPRTGGMVLCETIGKHPKIKVLNEYVEWKHKIKEGGNFVIKPFWFNIYNEQLGANIFKDYPDAKFIFITRNPLDIAASYKRLGLTGRSLIPLLLAHPLKEESAWITAVKQYKDKLIWLEQYKNNVNLTLISFEDMILKKHETFKQIFTHVGFTYVKEVKSVVEKSILNDAQGEGIGRSITTSKNKRIGGYEDILTRWEIKKIKTIFPKFEHAS